MKKGPDSFKAKILAFILFLAFILSCLLAQAAAFDGNDYGGGYDGGWDGGGYDGDGGGYGDFDWDEAGTFERVVYVIMSAFVGGIFVLIIIAVFISVFGGKNNKSKGGAVRPGSHHGLHINLPDRTAEIESFVKGHDPNFSASDFVSFVKRVYIDIQTAWCKRDLPSVRVLLHDNLYDATEKQIQAKIEQGVIYHYESMVVNTAYITSYAKDAQFEYVALYLNARMIDWQEDEKTGKILRGDKTTRWDLRYKMKFMRSAGAQTKEAAAEASSRSCPNCGAPLAMASSAKCEYCGAVITTGQYGWVLSDFGTVRDDTVDEGVRLN